MALVQQLQNYIGSNDWERTDWSQVERILHTARKEFHACVPVERNANSEAVSLAFKGGHLTPFMKG